MHFSEPHTNPAVSYIACDALGFHFQTSVSVLGLMGLRKQCLHLKQKRVGSSKTSSHDPEGLNIFNGIIAWFLPKLGIFDPWWTFDIIVSFNELILQMLRPRCRGVKWFVPRHRAGSSQDGRPPSPGACGPGRAAAHTNHPQGLRKMTRRSYWHTLLKGAGPAQAGSTG